jgi:Protein of unknown function (DUF2891)
MVLARPTAIVLSLLALSLTACPPPVGPRAAPGSGGADALVVAAPDQDLSAAQVLTGIANPPERALDAALASKLVKLSLDCVDREYPNKPSDVQASDEEVLPPRKLHPVFFGCFDWHSAVHGHWAMTRVLRTFPKAPEAKTIRAALNKHLTRAGLQAELRYFKQEHHKLFERPYGWGWYLRLVTEVRALPASDPDAKRWAAALEPLEQLLTARTVDYLKRLSVPVRAGTHNNTAFALNHIHDYAVARRDVNLLAAIIAAAQRFYGEDSDCPLAYEPSGEDFISGCLAEADLMRRVLGKAGEGREKSDFNAWLDRFLPPLTSPKLTPLLTPPRVLDRKDPKIGHLIGLSMQRAWTMKGIASALQPGDPRAEAFRRLAGVHRDDALKLMFGSGYGGAHWLASFAVYMLGVR